MLDKLIVDETPINNQCKRILDSTNLIWDIETDKIHAGYLDPYFKEIKPISWEFYLPNKELSLEEVFFTFIVNSALNGGYFYPNGEKWEVDGSGSKALETWLNKIREEHLWPVDDIRESSNDKIDDYLDQQPNPEHRKAIFFELCNPYHKEQAQQLFKAQFMIRHDETIFYPTFHTVNKLAEIYPYSFGNDPFRKKAILSFLLMSGYLTVRGYKVENHLPIAADYQIPRILEYFDIMSYSPDLSKTLSEEKIIDVKSDYVMVLRAASILTCNMIARHYNIQQYQVDNVLFGSVRGDYDFEKHSHPPTKCLSMWF